MEQIGLPAYQAAYDPHDGTIQAIGPHGSLAAYKYVINIDTELAEQAMDAKIPLHLLAVDFEKDPVECVLIKNVENKIDDILHRIIEYKWSKIKSPSVVVEYNQQEKTITFGLTKHYDGQYVFNKRLKKIKPKLIRWQGDTLMHFYATNYNDPHVSYYSWAFDIDTLRSKNIVYNDIILPETFSIFTRRLLDDYVLVIK
jgi:hypothetical protein